MFFLITEAVNVYLWVQTRLIGLLANGLGEKRVRRSNRRSKWGIWHILRFMICAVRGTRYARPRSRALLNHMLKAIEGIYGEKLIAYSRL